MMRMTQYDPQLADLDEWPADVDLINSAMDAARDLSEGQRRQSARRPHRVIARVSLGGQPTPTRIYTRDCDPLHLGFITDTPLPLGFQASVTFTAPDGTMMTSSCIVYRCRECVPGWYEGALTLARPIPALKLGHPA